jgi:hypothetical protein
MRSRCWARGSPLPTCASHFQAIVENFVVGGSGACSKRKRLFRALLAIRLELSSRSPETEIGLVWDFG